MKLKWRFEIKNSTTNYIRNMAEWLNYDVTLYYEYDDFQQWYYFSSVHLNELTDPKLVYERAYKLKLLVDGFSFIIHEDKNAYSPLVLGNLYDDTENVIKFDIPKDDGNFNFAYTPPPPNDSHYNSKMGSLLMKASHERFLRNILLICSNGMDFISLYKVYDEVLTFLNGQDKIKNYGNKNQIELFKHTVNNFEALGINARHGSLSLVPPENPMKLEEAQALFSDIIRKILKKHFEIELPTIKSIKKTEDGWLFNDCKL